MEHLSLDQFNPTKEQLVKLADAYRDLTIKDVSDKEGYARVHKARVELKANRVQVTKIGKELREKTNEFNKKVIAFEKDLIAVIEPVEEDLQKKQDAIDEEIERRKRVSLLPARIEQMASIEDVCSEDVMLSMDEEKWAAFFNDKKAAWLLRKEEALKAEQEKIEAAKRAEEDAKNAAQREKDRQIELEKAREEGERKAQEKENERKAKEEAEAAAAKAQLEKNKKFNEFMKKHGADQAPAGEFYVKREGETVTLYKRIDAITI